MTLRPGGLHSGAERQALLGHPHTHLPWCWALKESAHVVGGVLGLRRNLDASSGKMNS